jgi:DNA-binding LacI/PurR family transcriptional regulator
MTAVGIYAGCRELGLSIPHDISVVGFDDIHLCQIVSPPLTTVRQPLEALMKSAVDLLIGRMEEKSRTAPEHLTLTPELVVRESTAPAPAR